MNCFFRATRDEAKPDAHRNLSAQRGKIASKLLHAQARQAIAVTFVTFVTNRIN
jgi:hypothetical protein